MSLGMELMSQDEVQKGLKKLNTEQREYVENAMRRGRKTAFSNVLAKFKGGNHGKSSLDEILDTWEFIDYIDSGYVNPETRCLCGRPLRYQYIVKNQTTGETITFGKDHFEQHTGIPTKIAIEVMKGVNKIDWELTEILTKIEEEWSLDQYIDVELLPGLDIPQDIDEHIELGLPLLGNQLRRLERIMRAKRGEQGLVRLQEKQKETEIPLENATLFDFSSETPIEQQVDQYIQDTFGIDEEDKQKEMSKQKLSMLGRRLYGGTEIKKPLHAFLNDREVKLINDYIENDKFNEDLGISTMELSEGLVKRGSFKDTYITDKPKIYPYVASYLDFLVAQGYLVLISDLGTSDRVYAKAV
ncbi:DUF3895 domain-containing protein [Bacillus cereus]|nr:DUF3895 domain-containing protein [Bacillus cereus]